MSTTQFKVNKLIRDKVSDLLLKKDIKFFGYTMSESECIDRLKDKLLEEAMEVVKAQSPSEMIEELADVIEVINSLSTALEITNEEIEIKRLEKQKTNGGFSCKTFCSHIEVENSNPAINYYKNKPTEYPEMKYDHKKK